MCYASMRIATRNVHDTGCTLSSAIAAHSVLGHNLIGAIGPSKIFTREAIAAARRVKLGGGPGPDLVYAAPQAGETQGVAVNFATAAPRRQNQAPAPTDTLRLSSGRIGNNASSNSSIEQSLLFSRRNVSPREKTLATHSTAARSS